MRRSFMLLLLFLSTLTLFADEGMWMLHLLKQQKYPEMKRLGLELKDYDIYNPDGASIKDAVVQFGSGCTGEVISSRGLVLTNHHCGYGTIQSHSTLEHNYLEDGFWARSQAEELPNPGLTVTFIDKVVDVTDYVKRCLDRDRSLDKDGVLYLSPAYLKRIAVERVGSAFLEENAGTDVEIKPFFEGNQYFMFIKKIYADVRLVGAPPSSIGKFGADTDNWMWPRHTGDFTLFRIYADKEGNPAPYSPDNVPLKPKRWLTVSTQGVKANDFVMILGFPGSTQKFSTSWEVAERRDIDNKVRINMRQVRQETLLKEMLADPQVKIQYASKYSGSTNAYKSAIGSNWAIDKHNFVEVKKVQQERLAEWARRKNRLHYLSALDTIRHIVEMRSDLRYRERMLNEGIVRAIEFASVPVANADSLIVALQKKDEANAGKFAGLLARDYRNFANKNYSAAVDRRVAKAMIAEYVRLIPREKQPSVFSVLHDKFGGDVDRFVDSIFENSIFGSEANLEGFLAAPSAEALVSDPMFNFARSVRAEEAALIARQGAFNRACQLARRTYLEGILEMDGATAYAPDANLTLRLAYGQVKGYSPRDAVYYLPQTTIEGVMEKEDPLNWEFVVPEKLKQLYNDRDYGRYALPDGNLPVAFLASTHTTGGNSGSPVMNARGELVGINFDRNWEGVGGDIQYLPDYQRSIIVDIRYVLFIIDKYAGATHLIEEMDIR
ncbi:S46 family peptidase [Petrimonas mucosa]|uniref:Dipeptidyl-peptidase n=2 Tax=Petrimonas mucosa TaxID=1642646 RepID=A0A1G4GAE8_9BACT|nr:S46 family peptidase [Petrimonas mucosa]SCM59526.1 Asp/Glu-specific dipeptidyl-peptidase {ECO:0000303/PubMed:21896480} [Petrimonas mucosa]